MLYSALLLASSVFAGVFAGKEDFSFDSSSSSSFGSLSSVSSRSSRSLSSSSAPSVSFYESSFSSDSSSSECFNTSVCDQALKDVTASPNGPAYAYFVGLQKRVQKQAALWFNPSTQAEAINNFANQYNVQVHIADAFGTITYRVPASTNPSAFTQVQFPEVAKSWALNTGVMNQGTNGVTYFSFPLFDHKTAQFLQVALAQSTSVLPKNQLCFRKPRLNRLY